MKKFEKFNRVAWISYFAIILLNILCFPFLMVEDGAWAWADLFLVQIVFLNIFPSVFALVSAIVKGIKSSVIAMPIAFFIGSVINQLLTWNVLHYKQDHVSALFTRVDIIYAINAFIASAVAIVLGLAIHYAVKYFKRSRATA